MASIGIMRTQQEQKDIDAHATHRTKDMTLANDSVQQCYCLDCEVKFSTGLLFVVKDY